MSGGFARFLPIFGYGDPTLVRIVREKTERFRFNPDHPSAALLEAAANVSAVLDVGGAFGTDYWRLRSAGLAGLKWAVVEQPRFVAAADEFATDDLRFFADCATAVRWLGAVDLLWSSSTLPYVPDPERMIEDWLTASPRRIALSRMMWSASPRRHWQWSRLSENGPGPLAEGEPNRWLCVRRTLVPSDWVARRLHGYRIVRVTDEGLLAERVSS